MNKQNNLYKKFSTYCLNYSEIVDDNYNLETLSLDKKLLQDKITFLLDDLKDIDKFSILFNCLNYETRYSIIFRVRYNSPSTFKMLGPQIGIIFTDILKKKDELISIQDILLLRLDESISTYDYSNEDIVNLQLIVFKLNYSENVIEKLNDAYILDSMVNNKDLVVGSKQKIKTWVNNLVPLTMDRNLYINKLIRLQVVMENNSFMGLTYKNDIIDINNLITDKNKILNNISDDFYYDDNSLYFLDLKEKYLIIINKTNLNTRLIHKIYIFTRLGYFVSKLEDEKIDDYYFYRKYRNLKLYVNSKRQLIEGSEININFEPIKPTIVKGINKYYSSNDPYIGTIDLETYLDDGISKIYAGGFYTKKNNQVIYYINELYDSDKIIIDMFNELLTYKYNNYTFYIHNMGKYDIIFIIKILLEYNKNNSNPFLLEPFFKDGIILSLKITSKKNNNTKYQIKLLDSYNILNHKLSDLSNLYDTEIKKGYFPYNFVKKNTLFYVGDKPDIKFYNNTINLSDYKNIEKKNWSLKEESIKYLKYDLISLFQVIDKFSDNIFRDFKVQVTNNLTISSLALTIYLNKFSLIKIPLINKNSIYLNIKNSYFGGITEVYKPYGENLFYYDVNSLYPYVALNPMPGLNCKLISEINKNINTCDKLFGFYYCDIETPNDYLGLLPIRSKDGIYMPNGTWSGMYFSEELKFAAKNGYKIFVKYGYEFNSVDNMFKKYVNYFYKIKSTTSNKVEKSISKSLLNNLFGRFGLDINPTITELIDKSELNDILQTKIIDTYIEIANKVLISYTKETYKNICDENNVDFFRSELNNVSNKNEYSDIFKNTSIVISSAITSYARIFMSKIKLDLLNSNYKIYYTDTDSIIINSPLKKDLVGNNLGNFKLEYIIKRGYFITSKTYCLVTDKDNLIIKAKGTNDSNLNENSFKQLLSGNKVDSFRFESILNYNEGYVNINNKKLIKLDGLAYKKRKKIYDNDIWIDTQPINIISKK